MAKNKKMKTTPVELSQAVHTDFENVIAAAAASYSTAAIQDPAMREQAFFTAYVAYVAALNEQPMARS